MSTILITGGYGFLGSYIVREMIKTGKEAIVLDIMDNNALLADIFEKVHFVKCNLTEYDRLKAIFGEYDISEVCHVASMVAPRTEEDLLGAFENNVRGTLNLLELSRLFGVESFFYGSSNGVYGIALAQGNAVDEDAPQFPWHMYGTTKVCCERLGEQYRRKYGLNFRGIRFPPIFGLERKTKGPTGFCDGMLREVLNGRAYTVNVGPETPIVSAITVQDAAKAVVCLMQADEGRLTRRIYNIGALSFTAQMLVEEVKKKIPEAQISFEPDTVISSNLGEWPIPSNRRAKKDWKWAPKYCDVRSYVACVIDEFKSKEK